MSDLSTHLAWDATTDPMDVAVIGTGHVGLITAVAMSVTGHRVVATDVDDDKIARLTEGEPHFYEPGLVESLERQLASGRLRFSSDPSTTVGDAEVVFICVGTPARADGEANLLAMETAAVDDRPPCSPFSCRRGEIDRAGRNRGPCPSHDASGKRRQQFEVVSNPEFLREGSALHDSLQPDRIVVGGESEQRTILMRRLYEPLTSQGCRLIETDIAHRRTRQAREQRVPRAQDLVRQRARADLSERAGADVTAVVDVMGSDPRIGRAFLYAGLGYGGFCFPKDLEALERLAARLGYDFPLLGEVARLNDEAVEAAAARRSRKPLEPRGQTHRDPRPRVQAGDRRRPLLPALALAGVLLQRGARWSDSTPRPVESEAGRSPAEFARDAYEAVDGRALHRLATEWEEFLALDLAAIRSRMAYPVVVDGRNLFDPAEMVAAGFSYYAVGRPARRTAGPRHAQHRSGRRTGRVR